MASVQVLKKQEHLEAGKRKLEEFRRKEAAEKAKKANSTSQIHVSDDINEKRLSEHEHARLTDSSGVGTSDAHVQSHSELSGRASKIATNDSDILGKGEFSSWDTNAKSSFLARNNDIHATVQENSYLNNEENKDTAASLVLDGFESTKDKFESSKDDYGSSIQVASGVGNDYSSHYASPIQENHTASHFTPHYTLSNINGPEKDLSTGNSTTFTDSTTYGLPMNSLSTVLPDKLDNFENEDNSLTPSPYQGTEQRIDPKA